jgi:hypothetical protein
MAFCSVVAALYRRHRFSLFSIRMGYSVGRVISPVGIGLIFFLISPFAGRIPSGLKNDVSLRIFLLLSYNRLPRYNLVPVGKFNT